MKLGQTSLIYFFSRLLSSLLGFFATLYFARLLGAEPLGIYYLVLGLVSWLAIAGNVGVSGAISKRVSEGIEREQFASAGTIYIFGLFVVLSLGLVVFRDYVDSYVGADVTIYIILILFVTLLYQILTALLTGVHLVHLNGLLSPVKTGGRSLLQVVGVTIGLGLTGLLVGYIAGYLLVTLLATYFVLQNLRSFSLPRRRHFRSLFDYAKFAWLGSLQSKMFNYTDIIILGLFVPSSLIGIYSIAWNIGQFLLLFAGAIKSTLFPEMSELSAKRDRESIEDLVEQALSYAGLLLIPGLVGSVIIGPRLLRLYGEEFIQGAMILGILIIANLFMSYQNQILNTLNAIDRPDLSFRVNGLFVISNVLLNVVLIYFYGWLGAAIATVVSVGISLVISYYMLNTLIKLVIPYKEIGRQWVAALIMGAVVYGGLWIENTYRLLGHNAGTVVGLVMVGAGIYFLVLLGISRRFRITVIRNLPIDDRLLL